MCHIAMEVSLDPTLGCGQAHRWRKMPDGRWEGVIDRDVVTLTQTPDGFDAEGVSDIEKISEYFRECDDLESILNEISATDRDVADLARKCPGLRILKQPPWECLATYVLATNVNVKRIGKMVESVCNLCGTDLGKRHSFPTPGQILDKREKIGECRLGFREERFLRLAEDTENGTIDISGLEELDYMSLVSELRKIYGVGPKVADCVALFGFGHLGAFPVDVRIMNEMERRYGVTGSYETVSGFGRKKFGRYAGYAQELLYHSEKL